MDPLTPLLPPLSPTASHNSTMQESTQLSTSILDAVFPGFSIIQRFLLLNFSIDIGLLVTGAAIILGTVKFSTIAGQWLNENFLKHFTTSVIINDSDDLYEAFTHWAATSSLSTNARTTQAVTPWKNLLELTESHPKKDHSTATSPLFNFSQARAEANLKNELHFGYHVLFHKGHPILVHKYYRSQQQTISFGWSEEKQAWHLTCLGRSRKPLMSLLEHVRKADAASNEGLTHVRRPANDYGEICWIKGTTRGLRPMQSVIMEQEQKENVIRDLNDFMWPQSAVWYASRGIPHRRGYLFSGPPGTGKTSLSFALAGVFGLRLYVMSLTDKGLSDSGLLDLFCALPDRCIVLLEDVDTAGLKRKGMTEKEKNKSTLAEAAAEKDPKTAPDDEQTGSKVTLSGLLNAIDGVATHEGRVIIMTSNCPDELDPALIRPGRIDKHVKFGLATRRQISELFLSMYTVEREGPRGPVETNSEKVKETTFADACRAIKDSFTRESAVVGMDMKDLRGMSEEFARRIPEEKFSPAEIQGFLLLQERRHDPRKAMGEVEKWVEETLKEKAEKEEKEKEQDNEKKMKEEEERSGIVGLGGIWSVMG